MRFLVFILLVFAITISGIAQSISVHSFDLLERDLDARVHNPMYDQNGELCALIKVVTPHTGFEWEPDVLGIVESFRKTGEYWLYVPRGARRITIKHDDLGILRNYEYPIAIRSGEVYEMVLTTADIQVIVTDPVVESQWIIITSEPPGADVYINDEPVGVTPYQNELPVGRYDWRINESLYKPAAGVIELEAGDGNRAEIHGELEPDYGTLVINSTPESGAAITVNGFETGETTPASIPRIQSGEVLITLRLSDYETTNRRVELPAGQELPVDIDMRPTFAMVSIDTEPSADIYINDERQGSGSWEGRLGSGMYTFEARLDRHRPATDRSQVRAREDRRLTLRPEPISGSLRVVSLPIGAGIRLTDVATGTVTDHGTTPNTLRNLLIGDYDVELSRSGHATVSEQVTIAEGETTEVNVELPAGMEVTITSEPAGADVYIDGRRLGVTPYTGELGFGSHKVRTEKDGTFNERSINIRQGGESRFAISPPPLVTTGQVSNISAEGARVSASVNSSVTTPVTDRGVCWSTRSNPTIGGSCVSRDSGVGQFSADLRGLQAATRYFVRAYAQNKLGTFYGEQQSFTTDIKTFTVTINSRPGNAKLFINNKEQGETPFTENLAQGIYSVKLQHKNHYDFEERIKITDYNAEYDFRLNRTSASKKKRRARVGQLTLGTIFFGAGVAVLPGEEDKGGAIALISIGGFFYFSAFYDKIFFAPI